MLPGDAPYEHAGLFLLSARASLTPVYSRFLDFSRAAPTLHGKAIEEARWTWDEQSRAINLLSI